MKRRATCPEVGLSANPAPLTAQGEPQPGDLVRRAIAGGNCLIRIEGRCGRPDFTILDVNVRRRSATGRRAALIRHGPDGGVTLTRVTAARTAAIGPLLLPVPEISASGNSRFGLWRPVMVRNLAGPDVTGPDAVPVLSETLGPAFQGATR